MRTLLVLAVTVLLSTAHAADDAAEARVGADRFVVGGNVIQSRAVEGGLLAAAGNVRIEAAVGGDARLVGGNVEIAPEGRVAGNVSAAGGTIEIRGPVGGRLAAAAGNVLIDAAVAGDVRVAAGELTLGPNARIGGRLKHTGIERIRRDPAATIAGGIERGERPRPFEGRRARAAAWGTVAWTLGLAVLAALIAASFPAATRRVGESLRAEPALAFLLGFVALVCAPVAAMLLLITIVGIPLAVVLLLVYFLVLLVGYATIAVVIGDAALARLRSRDAARPGWRVAAAVAATVALALVTHIPWVGGLIALAVALAGLGAIVLAVRARHGAPPPAQPA